MKRLFALVGLMLVTLILPARAQSPDDQYLGIYGLIQQADTLNNSDQPTQALPRYLEAQSALQKLQKLHPDWQVKVVNFRLNYVAGKIADLTSRFPAATVPPATNAPTPPSARPPRTTQAPDRPAPSSELERQVTSLQDQVRLLQADKTVLEAKLKEALATQPAAVDPRELAKAEEKIQSLMKENDLLKASLATEQSKPSPGGSAKALEETRKAAEGLRAENELLKKQVADLRTATPASAGAGDPARQLAQARAQIAAMQSDADILRLEKVALQNRVKQMNAAPAPTTVVRSPNLPEDAERIRQLERERDDLSKKLESTNKELYGRKGRDAGARIDELSDEIATLRARLEVFEARAVPYTTQELALFKPAATQLAAADSGRKSVKELPADSKALVMEAQRHFSAREFDKAEAKYMEILRHDDKNAYTLANLAAIQLELNHVDEAEKHVKQALVIAPDDGYSLSILGYLRFRQEKYDEAFDALSRAAKANPQSAEIQNYLGVTLSHKGLRVPAETALRKAIQLDPDYASAHNNLAVIYVTQPQPAVGLARWHYQKALAAGHARNPELEKMLDQKSASGTTP